MKYILPSATVDEAVRRIKEKLKSS